MRRRAGLKKINDALGLGRKMQFRQGALQLSRATRQQRSEGHRSKTTGASGQKRAARKNPINIVEQIHNYFVIASFKLSRTLAVAVMDASSTLFRFSGGF